MIHSCSLFFLLRYDKIYHLIHFTLSVLATEKIHVIFTHLLRIPGITYHLINFVLDTVHVHLGGFYYPVYRRIGRCHLRVTEDRLYPRHHHLLIWSYKFQSLSVLVNFLIQLISGVDIHLHKYDHGCIFYINKLFRKLLITALEETTVFYEDHSPVCKKWHLIAKVYDFLRIYPISCKFHKIQIIIFIRKCAKKLIPVLIYQVSLLAIQKIDLCKFSGLYILIYDRHSVLLLFFLGCSHTFSPPHSWLLPADTSLNRYSGCYLHVSRLVSDIIFDVCSTFLAQSDLFLYSRIDYFYNVTLVL